MPRPFHGFGAICWLMLKIFPFVATVDGSNPPYIMLEVARKDYKQ